MNFLLICWRLVLGFLSGHSHKFTLLRWDDEEACLYVECWECGARSYGDAAIKRNQEVRSYARQRETDQTR